MINFDNLKFDEGYFLNLESLLEIIYENDGSTTQENQTMSFKQNDLDVIINYEVFVEGKIKEERGDYWTPSSCEIELENIDINISDVFIDDELVNLDNEDILKIEALLKKHI